MSSAKPSQSVEDDNLLIFAYTRNAYNRVIPVEIINIIHLFFRIIFDFNIIDSKYGSKDALQLNDIPSADTQTNDICVVISINSGSIKAGFAGSDYPIIAIPNIIATTQNNQILIGNEVKNATLSMIKSSPIKNGDINDWDAIKAILFRIFSKLNEHKKNISVLMTECLKFPKKSREKMVQFMFEEMNIKRFNITSRTELSLYASGRTTGAVILSDYHCTEIVPIYEGYMIKEAAQKINIGRRDVLRYLEKHKEKLKSDNDALEILFHPKLIRQTDEEQYGDNKAIEQHLYEVIIYCDVDIRSDLWSNIVLSGINTIDLDTNECFNYTLSKKVTDLSGVPSCFKVKVVASPERAEYAWIGGSILASLSTFDEMWMTKQEYDEYGAQYVHKKC